MNFNSRTGHVITLIFLAFIWGSSFILMKRGLEVYSPNQVAALRLFISFLVLLPFAIPRLKLINGKNFLFIAIAGFLGSGVPAFLYTFAQQHVNSSVAGILNALTPLFTMIVAVFLFRTKVSLLNVIGIFLGLVGASALIVSDFSVFFDENNIYGLLIVLATFLYGYNTNQVKHFLKDLDGIGITSLSFFMVGPFAGIYLLFSDIYVPFSSHNGITALGYIAILAIVGTALAMMIWNTLIKKLTAIYASSVTYIIPVFAIMWGVIDGEGFSFRELIAIALIFAGIYLVNKKEKYES
jgi:drug/metabolite transporter (DMT)-like permease